MRVKVIKHSKKDISYIPVVEYGDIELVLNVRKNKKEPISSEIVEMTEKELKRRSGR